MDRSTIEDYVEDLLSDRKQLFAAVREMQQTIVQLNERIRDLTIQLDQCSGR